MRTNETWREFAEDLLDEYGGGRYAVLARKLGGGIHNTTVRNWVLADSLPSIASIEAVAKLTGIDRDTLFAIRARSVQAQERTLADLPAVVRDILDVVERLPRGDQRAVLDFARYRLDQVGRKTGS